jgi:hypothetical protein
MNTPLILFEKKLPIEIIFYIQRYVSNDFAFEAIKKHIKYSYNEEILYRQFVYNEYLTPNCPEWCTGFSRRYNDRCDHCNYFLFTKYYNLQKYKTCVYNNNQLEKFNVKPTHCKYPMYNLNYF